MIQVTSAQVYLMFRPDLLYSVLREVIMLKATTAALLGCFKEKSEGI